jgi:hypothetical protein
MHLQLSCRAFIFTGFRTVIRSIAQDEFRQLSGPSSQFFRSLRPCIMLKRLKKLSVKSQNRNTNEAETVGPGRNRNVTDPASRSRGESSFLSASSRDTSSKQAETPEEQTNDSEPETEESERYDLDREPHGLFVLYPKPDQVSPPSDIEVE